MKTKSIISLILRLIVGIMFITTAVLKLLSIDEVEIYIYSFNVFNFVLSTVIARLLIAAEFILGVLLISKILYKQTWWLTMAMMIGFTLFLIYVSIFRNDTNCHCFGDFIQVNPIQSIIKNLITIIILLFVRKENDYQFRFKKLVFWLTITVGIVVPFVFFPMDSLYNAFVSTTEHVDDKAFNKHLQDSTLTTFNISDGEYLVGVFASGCKYCKTSARKVNTIFQKNEIDTSKFKVLIWGNKEKINLFKEETGAKDYTYYLISPIAAIEITYGKFPTFMFVKDGKIVKSIDYRGIEEEDLVKFLK